MSLGKALSLWMSRTLFLPSGRELTKLCLFRYCSVAMLMCAIVLSPSWVRLGRETSVNPGWVS